MPSRRNSIAMTDEEREKFLTDGWTLQVASVGHNGYPHLVAMWYVLIDGDIYFTTFGKSQKIKNLERDPKMTAMLEAGTKYQELKGLVIEGEGEIVTDNAFTAKVMGMVGAKYNGLPIPTETSEQAMKAAAKRVAVHLKPAQIYSWDHAKLGGRY
ncbi:MAG: pyridoxamine 5'-phosphate oxidase family protein [Dehalococcoidia bacterium]|nr:pyridoxamine 5'-phosphate oxidase family protein [Dehalococcoidia bacterium]